jgi:hypothetical protein
MVRRGLVSTYKNEIFVLVLHVFVVFGEDPALVLAINARACRECLSGYGGPCVVETFDTLRASVQLRNKYFGNRHGLGDSGTGKL